MQRGPWGFSGSSNTSSRDTKKRKNLPTIDTPSTRNPYRPSLGGGPSLRKIWRGCLLNRPFLSNWRACDALPEHVLPSASPCRHSTFIATNAVPADAPPAADRPLAGGNLIPHVRGEAATPPHEAIFVRTFDQQRSTIRGGDENRMTGQAPSLSQRFRGC